MKTPTPMHAEKLKTLNAINMDLLPSWSGAVATILEKRALGRTVLQECRKNTDNYKKFQLSLIGGEGEKTEATKAARDLLLKELPKQFRYVTYFHGCRVYEHEWYRRDGIMVCEPEWLLQRHIECLGWKMEDALQALDKLKQDIPGYLPHNEGKVFAVWSMSFHMEARSGFCHAKGSELLGLIASNMNPNRKEELYKIGEPSIIEFQVPLHWISEPDWKNYVNVLFVFYISHFVPYYRWIMGDPREGGQIFNRSIPPEHLVCRYLCNKYGDAKKLVEIYN